MRFLLFLFLAIGMASATVPMQTLVDLQTSSRILGIGLSPDGKTLCYLTRPPNGPGTLVNVLDVDAAQIKAQVTITQAELTTGMGGQFRWLNSSRFLVELGYGAIVALDITGKNLTRIVDPSNPIWQQAESVRVTSLPPDELGFAYLASNGLKPGATSGQIYRSYRVNLATGVAEQLAEEQWDGPIIFDRRGRMRIKAANFGAAPRFLHRGPDGPWQPLDQLAGTADTAPFDIDAAHYFGQRSQPIGFGDDPNLLYFASNAGRDTQGIYALDLRTGRRTDLAIEHPFYDLTYSPNLPNAGMLVFDPVNRKLVGVRYHGQKLGHLWIDPEIAQVQARIDALAGHDDAVIEAWDDTRGRFLVQRVSHTRRSSYALYFRAEDKLRSYVTEPAGSKTSPSAYTTPWAFKRESGEALTGYLTLPPTPRVKPTPIVVRLSSSPTRATSTYSADVAALAQMGYAVLEVNHRGTIGFGTRHWVAARGKAEHFAAEDIFLAVDRLAGQAGLDRNKVAIFHNATSAYLALRVAQIASNRIACVAVLDPGAGVEGWTPTRTGFFAETQRWFAGPDTKQWREHSALDQAAKLKRPLLITDFLPPSKALETAIDSLCNKMAAAGNEPDRVTISERFGPQRSARSLAAAEEFFAKHLGP